MRVLVFKSNPSKKLFDDLKVSGDIQKMRQLYDAAPNLAKRYFSCEDWIEMIEFEKTFSTRKILLENAINSISSFDECLKVYKLDTGYQFFNQLWTKFVHFSVSFDQMYETMDIFHEFRKSKTGKKVLKRMIELAETQEDFDILAGFIPSEDGVLTDALIKKASKSQNFSL